MRLNEEQKSKYPEMPDSIRQMVAEDVANGEAGMYEMKRKGRKWIAAVAASAAAFVLIFSGVCVTHPAMAENIPGLGSVFADIGDSLGFRGDYEKYASKVKPYGNMPESDITGYSFTDNGITISLRENYCSRNALYLSLTMSSEKPFPVDDISEEYGRPCVWLMGDTSAYLSFSKSNAGYDLQGKFVNDHLYEGVLRIALDGQLAVAGGQDSMYSSTNEINGVKIPDSFYVNLNIKNIYFGMKSENPDISKFAIKGYLSNLRGTDFMVMGQWSYRLNDIKVNTDKTETKKVKIDGLDNIDSITLTKTPIDLCYYTTGYVKYDPDHDYAIVITDADGNNLTYENWADWDSLSVYEHDTSKITIYLLDENFFYDGDNAVRIFHANENVNATKMLDKFCLWKKTVHFKE